MALGPRTKREQNRPADAPTNWAPLLEQENASLKTTTSNTGGAKSECDGLFTNRLLWLAPAPELSSYGTPAAATSPARRL